jgi:CBS domain containing-hemolysin-like protein
MAQVVIVLSFTTIISLMLATFWVVVQVRSIPDRVAYAQTESALFLSDPVTFFFSSLFTTRR